MPMWSGHKLELNYESIVFLRVTWHNSWMYMKIFFIHSQLENTKKHHLVGAQWKKRHDKKFFSYIFDDSIITSTSRGCSNKKFIFLYWFDFYAENLTFFIAHTTIELSKKGLSCCFILLFHCTSNNVLAHTKISAVSKRLERECLEKNYYYSSKVRGTRW